MAGGLFVTRMSRLFKIGPTMLLGSSDVPAHEDAAAVSAEQRVRADDLVVHRIDGPIFFGAADRFFEELLRVDHGSGRVEADQSPDMPSLGLSAVQRRVSVHSVTSRQTDRKDPLGTICA